MLRHGRRAPGTPRAFWRSVVRRSTTTGTNTRRTRTNRKPLRTSPRCGSMHAARRSRSAERVIVQKTVFATRTPAARFARNLRAGLISQRRVLHDDLRESPR